MQELLLAVLIFFGSMLYFGLLPDSGGLPEICYTYPIMMNICTVILCLKNIEKQYKSQETHF